MSPELTQNSGNSANAGAGVAVDARSRQLAGLRPWTPGNSGNPSGRPKSAKVRRHLLKQLNVEVAAGVNRLDCALDSLVENTVKTGDVAALAFIRDTVDGKPGPADGNTGPTNITVEIALVGGQ